MKLFLLLILLFGLPDKNPEAYIARYSSLAVEQMEKYGIPASITLAQACIESSYGTAPLAVKGHNHFGIKCHDWEGKSMKVDDDKKGECFRVYKSAEASFEDHSLFLCQRSRYRSLFEGKLSYKQWAAGLQQAGYATNPQYAQILVEIIERYKLDSYDIKRDVPVLANAGLYTLRMEREIFKCNKKDYVIARPGDTFASIAREYNLFTAEIQRFNDKPRECIAPLPGERVFLQRKASRAARGKNLHRVEVGDSLSEIAALYGIRLQTLCKMNSLRADSAIQNGQDLKLR